MGEENWGRKRKQLWTQIRSYLTKADEYDRIKPWMEKQDFMGRWMPESSTIHQLFSLEYYWSSAFNFFCQEYYGGKEWNEVHDRRSGEFVGLVMVTAINFLWEEEFDMSKESVISYLKPCQHIYNGMGMAFSEREGEFIDSEGDVVCFDPSVYNCSKSALLVKKEAFLKYLKENNLKLIWTVLGEKQIIGGGFRNENYEGRLEISGTFCLDDSNNILGSTTSKFEK